MGFELFPHYTYRWIEILQCPLSSHSFPIFISYKIMQSDKYLTHWWQNHFWNVVDCTVQRVVLCLSFYTNILCFHQQMAVLCCYVVFLWPPPPRQEKKTCFVSYVAASAGRVSFKEVYRSLISENNSWWKN